MYRYVILALVLTGCAASAGDFKRPADLYNPNPTAYPFHYASPYFNMYWRCTTPQAGGVSVDGYSMASMNVNEPLQNFNVTLSARDAKGRKLIERFTWGDDQIPSRFDPDPFEVSVPPVAGVVRYDIYYDFQVRDPATASEQFGTIEDVCGSRWRRIEAPPAF